MGRNNSKPVKFTCSNDCRQMGCPGHELVLSWCRSSDTVAVMIDGKIHSVFDDGEMIALLQAAEEDTP